MLTHIVMLRLEPSAGEAGAQRVADGLSALVGKVPGLVASKVGIDLGHAEGNASVIGIMEFESEEAWRAYGGHPAHKELISSTIAPILAGKSAIQVARLEEAAP